VEVYVLSFKYEINWPCGQNLQFWDFVESWRSNVLTFTLPPNLRATPWQFSAITCSVYSVDSRPS
jgi:hypothetical protein